MAKLVQDIALVQAGSINEMAELIRRWLEDGFMVHTYNTVKVSDVSVMHYAMLTKMVK